MDTSIVPLAYEEWKNSNQELECQLVVGFHTRNPKLVVGFHTRNPKP
jgi:hypothetical protein